MKCICNYFCFVFFFKLSMYLFVLLLMSMCSIKKAL